MQQPCAGTVPRQLPLDWHRGTDGLKEWLAENRLEERSPRSPSVRMSRRTTAMGGGFVHRCSTHTA
eukprot:scaffold108910_cov35-Tisochrysis_lutea.AAC.4